MNVFLKLTVFTCYAVKFLNAEKLNLIIRLSCRFFFFCLPLLKEFFLKKNYKVGV